MDENVESDVIFSLGRHPSEIRCCYRLSSMLTHVAAMSMRSRQLSSFVYVSWSQQSNLCPNRTSFTRITAPDTANALTRCKYTIINFLKFIFWWTWSLFRWGLVHWIRGDDLGHWHRVAQRSRPAERQFTKAIHLPSWNIKAFHVHEAISRWRTWKSWNRLQTARSMGLFYV